MHSGGRELWLHCGPPWKWVSLAEAGPDEGETREVAHAEHLRRPSFSWPFKSGFNMWEQNLLKCDILGASHTSPQPQPWAAGIPFGRLRQFKKELMVAMVMDRSGQLETWRRPRPSGPTLQLTLLRSPHPVCLKHTGFPSHFQTCFFIILSKLSELIILAPVTSLATSGIFDEKNFRKSLKLTEFKGIIADEKQGVIYSV